MIHESTKNSKNKHIVIADRVFLDNKRGSFICPFSCLICDSYAHI